MAIQMVIELLSKKTDVSDDVSDRSYSGEWLGSNFRAVTIVDAVMPALEDDVVKAFPHRVDEICALIISPLRVQGCEGGRCYPKNSFFCTCFGHPGDNHVVV